MGTNKIVDVVALIDIDPTQPHDSDTRWHAKPVAGPPHTEGLFANGATFHDVREALAKHIFAASKNLTDDVGGIRVHALTHKTFAFSAEDLS